MLRRYEPIIAKPSDWPILKIYQSKKDFLEAVSNKAVSDLLASQTDLGNFRLELAKALASEQERLHKLAWRVDRRGDNIFFPAMIAALQDEEKSLAIVLKEITWHYSQEIVGGFNIWHYRLAQATGCYILNRLLNPLGARQLRGLARIGADLREQIEVEGDVDTLRQLARIGTLVMVPTHCSHFDSVVIGWLIHMLGLPSFMYGAGRNLFNSPFFRYFLNKLGTYKVDRRKKNIAYLTTLKAYSSMALHWGCHSLFYPGGTRSRSGALESSLKLGLLGTTLEAQQMNFQAAGPGARKLFIIPVIFNYHCVVEAPLLVRDYLASQGIYADRRNKKLLNNSYKLLKVIRAFATKSSTLTVSIGKPLDVFGNFVDAAGQSYDADGLPVDIYKALMDRKSHSEENIQGMKEHTRHLAQCILNAYSQGNCVLSSYLLAFTAFELLKRQYADKPLKMLLMSKDKLEIPYTALEGAIASVQKSLLRLAAGLRIRLSAPIKDGTPRSIIQHGLAHLGAYHAQLPLAMGIEGTIVVNDSCTLFFYHNRLVGYELEQCIS
jgi:glycerol-3-phosphate O-acyltransferase